MARNDEIVDYGKPLQYDRNFDGPLSKRRTRGCTDVPCLFIFVAFLCGWGFIAHYAVKNGDLNKLMAPVDSFNQKCGMDSHVLHKPYLFFFDLNKCIDPVVPITGCPTPQVCVESCPKETFIWETMKNSFSVDELKRRLICKTDADKNNLRTKQDIDNAIKQERCANYYIKSFPVFNRCMWALDSKVCDYIPPFLLQNRQRRHQLTTTSLSFNNDSVHVPTNVNDNIDFAITQASEAKMQAMALTMAEPPPSQHVSFPQSNANEENSVCRHTLESETVIKEKMLQTDTRLAKFIGNMVAHFYNGTHDVQRMGEAIVEDIVNSSRLIFIVFFCTLIASLIFISLMRWLSAPILWLSIIGVLLGLAFGIYFTIKQYTFWRDTPTVPNHAFSLHNTVKNFLQEPNTWLYLTIFLCICLVVILLLVIVLRSRINIAIALTKEGSKAVTTVVSTVFFPIFSWILFIGAIVYAIGVGLYLGSIGEPMFRMIRQLDDNSLTGVSNENCICEGPASIYRVGDKCDPDIFQKHCYKSGNGILPTLFESQRTECTETTCSFVQIAHPRIVQWFIVYNVFGFFWLTFFISAFSDMVLATTFANWYWTFKKSEVPYFTLTRAFFQTLFYHLGTLAFGSLILAICRMIRLILEYIDKKLKKFENPVTRAILCCMKCFFWLLENFLQFLNRNAYIMCAIHGKNFCSSAKDAFNLIMRNFLRVLTLDKVTDFLFFMSKLLLTGAAGAITYFYLVNHPSSISLNYNAVPTTIVVIITFLITSVCFGVYSMAVDTLFLCFLEDCERNDGTPQKPYYMSKNLMKILGKRNQIQKQRSNVERH